MACSHQPKILRIPVNSCPPMVAVERPEIKFEGPDEGCPEEFEACLRLEAAAKLRKYISLLEAGLEDFQKRCSEPAPSAKGTSSSD